MTQTEISKALGISQSHYSRILDGNEFGKKTAKKIAAVIDLPWQSIFIMKPAEIAASIEQALNQDK